MIERWTRSSTGELIKESEFKDVENTQENINTLYALILNTLTLQSFLLEPKVEQIKYYILGFVFLSLILWKVLLYMMKSKPLQISDYIFMTFINVILIFIYNIIMINKIYFLLFGISIPVAVIILFSSGITILFYASITEIIEMGIFNKNIFLDLFARGFFYFALLSFLNLDLIFATKILVFALFIFYSAVCYYLKIISLVILSFNHRILDLINLISILVQFLTFITLTSYKYHTIYESSIHHTTFFSFNFLKF
jgi:hypothetical protein